MNNYTESQALKSEHIRVSIVLISIKIISFKNALKSAHGS